MTRSLSSGIPRTPDSTKRAMCGTCVVECRTSFSPRGSPTEQRGSIGAPDVRWLAKLCSMVTSASARAASKSPPATAHSCVLLVPNCSQTSGAPSSSALTGSTTTGLGSYSTMTSSAASSAAPLLVATTTATGSPTCLTSPRLSGQFTGVLISTPGGAQTIAIPPAKSPAMSSPVSTATTPVRSLAAVASIDVIAACASGERMIAACSVPGRLMSSV